MSLEQLSSIHQRSNKAVAMAIKLASDGNKDVNVFGALSELLEHSDAIHQSINDNMRDEHAMMQLIFNNVLALEAIMQSLIANKK